MKKWISILFFGFYLITDCITFAEEPSESHPQTVQILLQQKKWTQAVPLLRTLVQEHPNLLEAWIDLSIALTHLGSRTEALTLLNRAGQELPPNKKKFFTRRLNILARLFLTQETLQIYQTGLNWMTKKQYDLANEKFAKALKEEPDNTEILIRYGQSLLLSHHPQLAIEKLKTALPFYPFPAEVKLWLGRALFESNSGTRTTDRNLTRGIPELTSAFNELHASQLAPIWLAEALFSENQANSAIQLLELDYKKYPTHFLSLIQIGLFRLSNTRVEIQALNTLKKELQYKMSQLNLYTTPCLDPTHLADASDLIVEIGKNRDEVKEEMHQLQQKIEVRLQHSVPKLSSVVPEE